MILCPIQNTAIKITDWIQKRPRVTQEFGLNPQIYSRFGMKGHNGIDFGVPVGTPIFAPICGKVKVKKDPNGYGIHIKIRNPYRAIEVVLAHLSEVNVKDGDTVNMGDMIALSGNTGFSTGPHLHYGHRKLIKARGDVFSWKVDNYNNGYYGYVNDIEYLITWKGGFKKNDF